MRRKRRVIYLCSVYLMHTRFPQSVTGEATRLYAPYSSSQIGSAPVFQDMRMVNGVLTTTRGIGFTTQIFTPVSRSGGNSFHVERG